MINVKHFLRGFTEARWGRSCKNAYNFVILCTHRMKTAVLLETIHILRQHSFGLFLTHPLNVLNQHKNSTEHQQNWQFSWPTHPIHCWRNISMVPKEKIQGWSDWIDPIFWLELGWFLLKMGQNSGSTPKIYFIIRSVYYGWVGLGGV